jgi:hypothetical protein
MSGVIEMFEIIDSRELAKRWCVPESWIRDRTRTRTTDPIPHVRLGRYVRFEWVSPELSEWWAARRTTKGATRQFKRSAAR